MAPNPEIIKAVEQLDYRVTVGDVASQAGLNINLANQGLLALATDAGGHMQVAESGDIVYLFPKNFRDILRQKYLKLKLQETWQKVWGVLFYIIRISFGVYLISSILLIYAAIIAIMIAANSDRDDRNDNSGGFNFFFFPDLFWYLSPNYGSPYGGSYEHQRREKRREKGNLNFFEAVFSFLFGDGNPNAKLEERRWQQIAAVIRNNGNAVVAQQITPYLDDIGETYQQEYEDYMLPVLTKFNGQPKVSADGEIVYTFPELQVTAGQQPRQSVSGYLQELRYTFSAASEGQNMLSAGLGAANIVGAIVLGGLLQDGSVAAQLGGLVAFVQSIYWVLLAYGIGFLGVPLIRYFWIKQRNSKITERNRTRQQRAELTANPDISLQKKITFAREFATETIIDEKDSVYSTEEDLLEQDFKRLTD